MTNRPVSHLSTLKLTALAAVAMTVTLSGCTPTQQLTKQRRATALLYHSNGLPAGTALLVEAGSQLNLSVSAIGLSPGAHGVHLHMVGQCEAPGFTTAGGHLNPAARQHGSSNPAGSHLGDLPNLNADQAGAAVFNGTIPGTAAETLAQLFDADGTAIVIHASADDYRTDPSGNSGGRVACGVLKPV